MKRKIMIMKFVPDAFEQGAYEEVCLLPVAKHKGVPEAMKTAEREIKKLQRSEPDTKFGYWIVADTGEAHEIISDFVEV